MSTKKIIQTYLLTIILGLGTADWVHAAGTLTPDDLQGEPIGEYCATPYVKYTGLLTGKTDPGNPITAYNVPFVIRTPANPHKGNGWTLYEFPHPAAGEDITANLGLDFLFCRGFSQAAVGYNASAYIDPPTQTEPLPPPENLNILDPTRPGLYVNGVGNKGANEQIMVDFAQALDKDDQGKDLLGNNSRHRIVTGKSAASFALNSLLASGNANDLFALAMPIGPPGRSLTPAGTPGGPLPF